MLVLAPCGSGKTFLLNRLSELKNSSLSIGSKNDTEWLDGDELLKLSNIKNKNYYWYSDTPESKKARALINFTFEEYLNYGHNILYSGNPDLMPKTYALIIPNKEVRWNRLKQREIDGGWCPTQQQFEVEDNAYEKATTRILTIRDELTKQNLELVEKSYYSSC
jgi:hypothetical protein